MEGSPRRAGTASVNHLCIACFWWPLAQQEMGGGSGEEGNRGTGGDLVGGTGVCVCVRGGD